MFGSAGVKGHLKIPSISEKEINVYLLDPLLVMRSDVSDSRQNQRNHFQPEGYEEEAEPGKILDAILPWRQGDFI